MFRSCTNMTSLHLDLFNTKNCKYSYLFEECYKLTIYIDGSYFTFRNYCPDYVKTTDITD